MSDHIKALIKEEGRFLRECANRGFIDREDIGKHYKLTVSRLHAQGHLTDVEYQAYQEIIGIAYE